MRLCIEGTTVTNDAPAPASPEVEEWKGDALTRLLHEKEERNEIHAAQSHKEQW